MSKSKGFEKNGRWNDKAICVLGEFDSLVKPFFAKLVGEGYSPREISHLLDWGLKDIELSSIINRYADDLDEIES